MKGLTVTIDQIPSVMNIRAVAKITGHSRNTIAKWLPNIPHERMNNHVVYIHRDQFIKWWCKRGINDDITEVSHD